MTINLHTIDSVRGQYRGAFLNKEIIAHIKSRKVYADKLGWECGINLAETEIALLNAHEENKELRKALESACNSLGADINDYL